MIWLRRSASGAMAEPSDRLHEAGLGTAAEADTYQNAFARATPDSRHALRAAQKCRQGDMREHGTASSPQSAHSLTLSPSKARQRMLRAAYFCA